MAALSVPALLSRRVRSPSRGRSLPPLPHTRAWPRTLSFLLVPFLLSHLLTARGFLSVDGGTARDAMLDAAQAAARPRWRMRGANWTAVVGRARHRVPFSVRDVAAAGATGAAAAVEVANGRWPSCGVVTGKWTSFAFCKLNETELTVLVSLQRIWSGMWSSNNKNSVSCGDWAGITCNRKGNIVAINTTNHVFLSVTTIPIALLSKLKMLRQLLLSEGQLSGVVPEDISKLRRLELLSFYNTLLDGPIPASIGRLTKLQYLDLARTKISSLPSNLSALNQLTFLRLSEMTKLSITVRDMTWLTALKNLTVLSFTKTPVNGNLADLSFLSDLSALESLSLSSLNTTGDLPTLSALSRLTYLNLAGTMKGSFPKWILELQSLVMLDVSKPPGAQELSEGGLIPRDLSRLTRLKIFNANRFGFLGYLPDGWSALERLERLDLGRNRLEDSIPLAFKTLTALRHITLSDNQLVGNIPDIFSKQAISIKLEHNRLEGAIPSFLGSLSSLQNLEIQGNNLTGGIPESFFQLTSLTVLTLQQNNLNGSIPDAIARMTSLQTLDLQGNNLIGSIPRKLTTLTKLKTLSLQNNCLDGGLEVLSAMTALEQLDLSHNSFTGSVPTSLSVLNKLKQLSISGNTLGGPVPLCISSMSSLSSLNLENNRFSGSVPSWLSAIRYVEILRFGSNNLTGSIPSAALAINSLLSFSAPDNQLQQPFPSATTFTLLTELNLRGNDFKGDMPDLSPLNSSLKILDFADNHFTGELPDSLAKLSMLQSMSLDKNGFTGTIPEWLFNLQNLTQLRLQDNRLSGPIPVNLTRLTNLNDLHLSHNRLSNVLPTFLSELTGLQTLWVDGNPLGGPLNDAICNMRALTSLRAAGSGLYGRVAECIFVSLSLSTLDLSSNFLYGDILKDVSRLPRSLDLSSNYFSGPVRTAAMESRPCGRNLGGGGLRGRNGTLSTLLQQNEKQQQQQQGSVAAAAGPSKSSDPQSTQRGGCNTAAGALSSSAPVVAPFTNVNDNCFALPAAAAVASDRQCPYNSNQQRYCSSFCLITTNGACDGHGVCMPVIDSRSNSSSSTGAGTGEGAGALDGSSSSPPKFSGQAAAFACHCNSGFVAVKSESNGRSTCGVPKPKPYSLAFMIGIGVACFLGLALVAAVLACLLWQRRPKGWQDLDVCREFPVAEIVRATNGWAEENRLGEGGFATVYKGTGPDGQVWAVKRAKVMTDEFEKEVRAMASLRHENLVRLLGYGLTRESGRPEQILVYEYVGNGDLEQHIHRRKTPLSLSHRLQLACGAADGVAYLHSFSTPIIHRDLKPANILVAENMQAKVADFGLLMNSSDDADSTQVAGTVGYVDPDYARTLAVTIASDTYGFGIVLLEMLTGRLPTMEESPYHIRKWVAQKVQDYEISTLKDPMLEASDEAVVEWADIALDCIKMPCTRRPDMKEVARRLHGLQVKYSPNSNERQQLDEEPEKQSFEAAMLACEDGDNSRA